MVIMAIMVIITLTSITKTILIQTIITVVEVIVPILTHKQPIIKTTTIIRIIIGGTIIQIPTQATMAALILVQENGGIRALPLREAAALVEEETRVVLAVQRQVILAGALEEDNP